MLVQVAIRNTVKNWRHSLSALLSLSASFISLVMFDGYMYDVDKVFAETFRYKQMLGDLIIENPQIHSEKGVTDPWVYWIPPEQQASVDEFIQKQPAAIHSFTKSLSIQGMATSGKQAYIFLGRGYETTQGAKMREAKWQWDTIVGVPLNIAKDPMSAVIGFGLAQKIGCKLPEKFPFLVASGSYPHVDRPFECDSKDLQLSTTTPEGQLNAVDLNVVGVIDGGYKDLDDRFLHTSLEAAQTLMNTQSVSYYSIQLADPSKVASFINDFDKEVVSKHPELEILRWQDHKVGESYRKTMEFLSIFRNFIIIVILVVSTLSVVNTLVKIVKERTKEIGTLRSIGFKKIEIIKMFIYESICLAFIGSSIGCILSIIFSFIVNTVGVTYKAGMLTHPILFRIHAVPVSYLTAWVLLVVVSLIASYLSTLSILRGKIVENLNHT